MTSNSKKHHDFVAEPIGKKSVRELAGVGEVLEKRLNAAGYSKANEVLGKYLDLKKDKQIFQGWMKETSGANSKQSADCYKCLREWSEEFI